MVLKPFFLFTLLVLCFTTSVNSWAQEDYSSSLKFDPATRPRVAILFSRTISLPELESFLAQHRLQASEVIFARPKEFQHATIASASIPPGAELSSSVTTLFQNHMQQMEEAVLSDSLPRTPEVIDLIGPELNEPLAEIPPKVRVYLEAFAKDGPKIEQVVVYGAAGELSMLAGISPVQTVVAVPTGEKQSNDKKRANRRKRDQ